MNIERLTVISNYLKNPPADFKHGFNMAAWGGTPQESFEDLLGEPGQCGTVHCIAGLAKVFWGSAADGSSKGILDLTSVQAEELFFARGSNIGLSWKDITVQMAIQAIDALINTGKATWKKEEDA